MPYYVKSMNPEEGPNYFCLKSADCFNPSINVYPFDTKNMLRKKKKLYSEFRQAASSFYKLSLKDEQWYNLEKLANILEKMNAVGNTKSIPIGSLTDLIDEEQISYRPLSDFLWFHMDQYMEPVYDPEHGTYCGAAACALGHGPAAGIPLKQSEIRQNEIIWHKYAARAFGMSNIHTFYYEDSYEPKTKQFTEYGWIFSSEWTYKDNTPQGAAERINTAMHWGVPKFKPEFFDWFSKKKFIQNVPDELRLKGLDKCTSPMYMT